MIKKLVAWLAFLVLALYGIVLALVYFFTPQLMFPAPKPSYCAGELVKKINAGSDIIAVRVNKNSSADNWIIYSHGNGEDLGQIDLLMQEYAARLNANVVSYDYPGYGASMGHASEDRLGEYADAVYDYTVKELGADPKRIYFVGYSLGSVPAAYLAAKHLDARGAVLIGGIAEGAKTYLPVNVIPWKILPNVENVQKIQIPLLIIHGTADGVVNYSNAVQNYKAAKAASTLRLAALSGMGHYGLFRCAPYWRELEEFIKNEKRESVELKYDQNSCIAL